MKACPFLQRGRAGPGGELWLMAAPRGWRALTGSKALSRRMADPGAVPTSQQGGCLSVIRPHRVPGCPACPRVQQGAPRPQLAPQAAPARPLPPAHLQLVLLAVEDDSRDLLVHENEDGDEDGGHCGCQADPPGVGSEGEDNPTPGGVRGLQEAEGSRWLM